MALHRKELGLALLSALTMDLSNMMNPLESVTKTETLLVAWLLIKASIKQIDPFQKDGLAV